MKNVWKWIILGLAVFVLAFCIALPLFGGGSLLPVRMMSYRRMMPFGMMGAGTFGSFGWIGMLARLVLPLLFVGLVVAVVALLLRKPSAPPISTPPAPPAAPCRKCGKPVETGWVACPYCGTKV
jgi:hypothetical protein